MKNLVKVGFVVLGLLVAVLLLWRAMSGIPEGLDSVAPGQVLLVMCANKSCRAQTTMDKRVFFTEVDKRVRQNPSIPQPPLTCAECGKDSIFRAVKCRKCAHVFRFGITQRDVEDRCPKCKFSQIETERKQGG